MKVDKSTLVFITGGSSGIGLAIANQCVRQGASVSLFARDKQKLERAKNWIIESNPQIPLDHITKQIYTCCLDVTDHAQVTSTLSRVMQTQGVPHILITCAGGAYPNYFEQIPFEKFQRSLAVNLEGTWSTIAVVAPAMKRAHKEQQRKEQHIVTCSSIAGFVGTFGYTAYSAAKFGVIGLSEVLRSELKPFGISVSVLCPPDTDTPGFQQEEQTKPPETTAIAGKIKLLSPDSVAETLLKALRKKRFMIIPGRMGKLSFFLKSHLPRLLFRIMDHSIQRSNNE